jgi:hypothetical protein
LVGYGLLFAGLHDSDFKAFGLKGIPESPKAFAFNVLEASYFFHAALYENASLIKVVDLTWVLKSNHEKRNKVGTFHGVFRKGGGSKEGGSGRSYEAVGLCQSFEEKIEPFKYFSNGDVK